ncbi:a-macroglobulin complement component : Membrane protein containing Alpha-2-macroglobulin (Fragment) OS=Rhodopirellula maiorica SM1 GN=RMSM_06144 PE=4 SV=1: zf-HC2: A2M_N [Gemmataceae bacterium]
MLRCTECRPLILDHLFGLLDAPEVAAVAAHLATCPACAAERTEAAKVHGLISKAAKFAFPGVRFESPDAARPAPARVPGLTRTATLPVPIVPMAAPVSLDDGRLPVVPAAPKNAPDSARYKQAPAARGSWAGRLIPWAVAAAVLLAVPGTVVPVLDLLNSAEVARRDAAASTADAAEAMRAFEERHAKVDRERAAARVALVTAKQAHDGLLAKWVAEEKAAALAQDTRKLTWQVYKPAAVQPGAPNEFLLVVDQRGTTAGGSVVAEIRDQTDAVIHTQAIAHDRAPQHPIRLPADAWTKLKPDSELFLVVSHVDERTREKTVLQDKVRLLGPVFATVLTTDKPAYWPGETVRFRSLTLDRVTFTPPAREQVLQYELRSPAGTVVRLQGGTDLVRVVEGRVEPVKGPDGNPVRGVGTGEFALPFDAPEGDYTLTMRELPHPSGDPAVVPFPVSRTIKVEAGVPEVLNKRIGFAAASYSAGEAVEAWVDVRFKDKPLAGARVLSAVAVIDEQVLELTQFAAATDANGRANLRFPLPAAIARGDARVKVTVLADADGREVEESVAARVPVVGPNVTVEFFPEGGDLVAGVPCRVYVRATTPTGLPVEIGGIVTDGRRTLATVETLRSDAVRGANRGLGVFQYTPELGTPVWLKLAAPAGAYAPLLVPKNSRFPTPAAALIGAPLVAASRTGFLLPEPKQGGVVMTVLDPVTAPGKPIRVHLRSVGRERKLVVGAYTRGRLADTKTVTASPTQVTEVQLLAENDPRGGVVRVTVFEEPEQFPGQPKEDLKPVAERLVFRKPGEGLNLSFTTSGPRADGATGFAANAAVGLNVSATDEKGRPTAAVLYAAVVNSAVASGPKDRSLATHFLIAGEVNTPDALEYADFLLTDHPLAGESLDLVLGTQGWRRFAEQVPQGYARRPVAPTQEQAHLLVCNGQYMTSVEPPAFRDHQKIRDTFWPRYEEAVRTLDAAKAAAEAADADRNGAEGVQRFAAAANDAAKAAKARVERAELAAAPVERFRETGWFAVGGFGLLALMLGGACFARSQGRVPLGLGTAGALGLVAFLVVALGTADRTLAAGVTTDVMKIKQARLADEAREIPAAPAGEPQTDADPEGTNPAIGGASGDSDRTPDRKKAGPGKDEHGPPSDGKATPAKPGIGGFGASGGGPGAGLPKLGGAAPPQVPGGGFGGFKSQGSLNGAIAPGLAQVPAQQGAKREPGAPPGPSTAPRPATGAPPMAAAAPGSGVGSDKAPTFLDRLNGKLFAFPQRDAAGKGDKGDAVGEGGWQTRKYAKRLEISDAEVPSEWAYGKGRVAALAGPEAGNKDATTLRERQANLRRGAPLTKADEKRSAGETKEQARQEADYQQAVEKAKQAADSRAREFQNHMQDGLARQLKEAEQLQNNARPDANAAAAPPPNAPVRGGFVAVPAETRAIHRVGASVPTTHPLVVREYAAPRPSPADAPRDGSDEADTVLWQPVVVVPGTGKLTLPVQLGSAAGGYEVIVAGHTLDGRIGAVRGIIPVALPVPGVPVAPVPSK